MTTVDITLRGLRCINTGDGEGDKLEIYGAINIYVAFRDAAGQEIIKDHQTMWDKYAGHAIDLYPGHFYRIGKCRRFSVFPQRGEYMVFQNWLIEKDPGFPFDSSDSMHNVIRFDVLPEHLDHQWDFTHTCRQANQMVEVLYTYKNRGVSLGIPVDPRPPCE